MLFFSMLGKYRIYTKNWDRKTWANTVDPDQTPQNAATDQGLHCFATHPTSLHTSTGTKLDSLKLYRYSNKLRCVNIKGMYGKLVYLVPDV